MAISVPINRAKHKLCRQTRQGVAMPAAFLTVYQDTAPAALLIGITRYASRRF
ncbi:MAG TPA: hypothetical protein VHV10_03470 [Ktedonobacteraceae bacterium]|nr:hypothetical protein [Ktedonobacteraceae bacterium]